MKSMSPTLGSLAFVILALSACGGRSDGSEAAAPVSPTPQAQPTGVELPTKVTVISAK